MIKKEAETKEKIKIKKIKVFSSLKNKIRKGNFCIVRSKDKTI